ncbi:3-deoxy-manno-octulosonate cytidylyltransferase [candidate division KSB1 bacterium]
MTSFKNSRAVGIIPARYASSRFPGKPLALIAGRPMIRHVYENAVRAGELSDLLVATDDERIADCVREFGGSYVLTDPEIQTGTERVAAAAESIDADIILNIQGDEPLVPSSLLDELVRTLREDDVPVCTPVVEIDSPDDIFDVNQARVVFDNSLHALYFTRAPIPFNRDNSDRLTWLKDAPYWKHIGIYCFRRDFLFKFVSMPEGGLEKAEKLEQLRILENGFKIRVVKTSYRPVCVDVPEDIKRVETALMNR